MGALTKISEKCRDCPFVDKCENKRMEAHCYIDGAMEFSAASETVINSVQPALRETMQINIGGVMTTVYKDEIEKEIYKALREPFMLHFGA